MITERQKDRQSEEQRKENSGEKGLKTDNDKMSKRKW